MDALGVVGAEGFAEELAGGGAFLGGEPLNLLGELWGEADSEGARGAR